MLWMLAMRPAGVVGAPLVLALLSLLTLPAVCKPPTAVAPAVGSPITTLHTCTPSPTGPKPLLPRTMDQRLHDACAHAHATDPQLERALGSQYHLLDLLMPPSHTDLSDAPTHVALVLALHHNEDGSVATPTSPASSASSQSSARGGTAAPGTGEVALIAGQGRCVVGVVPSAIPPAVDPLLAGLVHWTPLDLRRAVSVPLRALHTTVSCECRMACHLPMLSRRSQRSKSILSLHTAMRDG